jgi:DNA-directed RNA polymerase subunit RPC12/RpoP
MFDTQEIYLSRLEQYKRDTPSCPHCGGISALKVIPSERNTGRRTYECLKCGRDFSISVMAEDDAIPF